MSASGAVVAEADEEGAGDDVSGRLCWLFASLSYAQLYVQVTPPLSSRAIGAATSDLPALDVASRRWKLSGSSYFARILPGLEHS